MVCNYILGYILSLVYNIWRNCHECFHLFRFRISLIKPKINIYLEPFLFYLQLTHYPNIDSWHIIKYKYLTYYPNISCWHIIQILIADTLLKYRLLTHYPNMGSWYITQILVADTLSKYWYLTHYSNIDSWHITRIWV